MSAIESDPKPKSTINGKTNPLYIAWWRRNNPEKAAASQKKYKGKRTGRAKKKKAIARALTNNCKKSILAMTKRGRSITTIAVVLRVPISSIMKALEDHQVKADAQQ